MKHLNFKNINIRRTGQWIMLIVLIIFWIRTIFDKNFLFDFEACCPFGGLQSIATYVVSGAMACTMGGMQIVMGGMLALSVILVSKLFCGYVCPIGTISEGLGRLGKRLKLPSYDLGSIADMAMRSLKYILLFITFYFTIKSNDLFCKKFDPFFATVTLFGTDVSAWMSGLAILLLVVGAIFLRQFWCRYLCPLGAISTAFKYFYVFVVFAGILIVLKQAEVKVNLTLILVLLTVIAYALELIGIKKDTGFQLLKIRRDEDLCIDCGICDNKCPQGIKVSVVKEVNHPDCNLCAECVGVCPDDQAIAINGKTKFRWLPILITVGLIMAGLILGANLSVPTLDEKWGDDESLERSAVYEMAGIKNVKCYGSSRTFVDKMKKVPGITGASTFVKDHRVLVMYDTSIMNEAQVRKSLFTPKFLDITIPENESEVFITDFYIENFFDELDVVFVANLVKDIPGIYSFETIYGKPVKVRFYTEPDLNIDTIKQVIENSNLIYSTEDVSFSSKDLFKVKDIVLNDTTMSGKYLKSLSFPSFQRAFNGRSQYTNDQLANVVVPISSYPRNTQLMPYIINHLGKADPYIVGLISQYGKDGPIAVVFYVKGKTTEERILELISMEEITITYDNGVQEKMNNPYEFKMPEGQKN
ncbi:MAG: 4Fe-4S binding protein [Bacteroidales bacterium]|nr:4Fe-4S binding protein [Bacteroidales bacterium]MCF8406115.1 4Fe-4S binding protein [Bacteroidales bacterium]